ncbi:MAG: DNA polymerase III subunit delta [Wenzhouxiangellaceae bacterium]
MKIGPEALSAQLERGLKPVYLFAGPERLILEEAADQLRAACRRAGIDERIRLVVERGFDWGSLAASTETGSLFSSRRLVELRLPGGKPGTEGARALREHLERGGDDVLLVLADQWDRKQESSAWFRAVEGSGVFLHAPAVRPDQLPAWLARRLVSRGLEADRDVVAWLAQRLEGNLLAAAQQVDLLALLYPGKRLLLEDLERAVGDSARFDAFRLVELAMTGQTGAALRCIRGLRETDQPPAMIVWALGRELEIADQVARAPGRAAEIFRQQHVWPARQRPVQALVRRLGPVRISALWPGLSRLERLAKGQVHEADRDAFWIELEDFCARLGGHRIGAVA